MISKNYFHTYIIFYCNLLAIFSLHASKNSQQSDGINPAEHSPVEQIFIANKSDQPITINWLSVSGSPQTGTRNIVIYPKKFRAITTDAQFAFDKNNAKKFVKRPLEQIVIQSEQNPGTRIHLKQGTNVLVVNNVNNKEITAQQTKSNDPIGFFSRLKIETQERMKNKQIRITNKTNMPLLLSIKANYGSQKNSAFIVQHGILIRPAETKEVKVGPYLIWQVYGDGVDLAMLSANAIIVTSAEGKKSEISLLIDEKSLTLIHGLRDTITALNE